jgi:hypothetical protein
LEKTILKRHLILAWALVLVGCASQGPSAFSSKSSGENFSLHTGPDGRVYRINNQNGDVWLVVDGSLKRLSESKTELLQKGKKYFIEDNFSMTYLGKGKFTEPVKDYSHLWGTGE